MEAEIKVCPQQRDPEAEASDSNGEADMSNLMVSGVKLEDKFLVDWRSESLARRRHR